MKKKDMARRYSSLVDGYNHQHRLYLDFRGKYERQEKALAYFRHQLNQAIETADHGHTVPPGSLHETSERLTLLRGRREAYQQVLSMLAAPVPPHFNPGTVNVYAERFVTASEE
jgi:hypothetical protein